MGFVNSLQLVNKHGDDELQRWAYLPDRDELHVWPWTESTHATKLYELGQDWRNPYWYGGYAAPSTGELSMSQGNHNMADMIEQRVRAEWPGNITSAVKELCPQCKHELVYVDKTEICPNCGWVPIGETDDFDPEEYLHERHFPEYHNDEMPNYLGKVVNLPDEFKGHNDYEDGRRTFIYLVPNDTIYIAPNNAFHNDIWYWLSQHATEGYAQIFDKYGENIRRDQVCLGLIQRDFEDQALVLHIYEPEGLERLPGHIVHELEGYFGEKVYQTGWVYPVDWTQINDYYPDDYEGEPTKQWPEGWTQEEGIYPSSGVIASLLKVAADVNALAAKAYDQIMARPDVAKIYDLAKIWEDKYQSGRDPGEPAKNMGRPMDINKIENPTPESQELVTVHNAHLMAEAIQSAIERMRNNYPGAYKLMPNAVKTIKTRFNSGLNVTRADADHIADIYGGAGELLTQLRQENRIPQGMDINQMDFAQVEDWLYNFDRGDEDTGEYKTNDVVYDLGNGWKIVQIKDDDDLHTEGQLMGHCVGTYCNRVTIGSSLIYSLRDPKNEPHATIEIEGQGDIPPLQPHTDPGGHATSNDPWQVVQIQGKSNQEPIAQYKQMIKQWFEDLQSKGVKFAPMGNYDFGEYVQDTEELMNWYNQHGNDSPIDPNAERDEYGLPLDENRAAGEFQFEWSTLIDYCLDNTLPKNIRKYREDYIYQPEELVQALTAAADQYHLAPADQTKLLEMGWNDLQQEEEKIDELNIDYYHDVANAGWEYHHPDEELDPEHEDYDEYYGEAQSEVHSELFSGAIEFLTGLQQAWTKQPTGRVIYV